MRRQELRSLQEQVELPVGRGCHQAPADWEPNSPRKIDMNTKITALTYSNIDALSVAIKHPQTRPSFNVTLGATIAIFETSAQLAAKWVRDAKVVLGAGGQGNQHPAKSLSAVIRKLEKQA